MNPISPFRWLTTAASLAIFCSLMASAPSQGSSSPDSVELLPAEGKVVGTAKLDRDLNHQEVIGSWRNPNDLIKWSATFPSPGIYDVILDYSQADGKPGSLMELAVGNQGLQSRLENTFSWENPCYQYLGQVQIQQPGVTPVNLRVIEKKGTWVMSVRAIRFRPSQAKALETPPHSATEPAVP